MLLRRVVAGSAAVALYLGISTAPGTAAPIVLAGPRTPVAPHALPAEYDAVASYEAQAICSPTPKPGTLKLIALLKKTYGKNQYMGTSRPCSSGGTSEHKDGRAIDWMTSARSPKGRANAQAFLDWIIGPDAAGVPNGNATRLGIMYIGWNNHFWRAYSPEQGWTLLDGCPKGNDTDCHRNHMHISLTWDGASGRTSMWDGTALAGFCAPARSAAVVLPGGRALDAVPITPFRALSTRKGVGLVAGTDDGFGWGDHGGGGFWGQREDPPVPIPLPVPVPPIVIPAPPPVPVAPCRVHRSNWRGDMGGILTKVTGQGTVPDAGVMAVAIKVTAQGSTAPADISVWAPGQREASVVAKVRMNRNGRGSAVVPLAYDGTIALLTSEGGVDLVVEVTGYFLAGDQPNVAIVR